LIDVGQKPIVQWQTTPPSPTEPREIQLIPFSAYLVVINFFRRTHQREVQKPSHLTHLPRGTQRVLDFNRQATLVEHEHDPDAKEVSERCSKEERFQPPRGFT